MNIVIEKNRGAAGVFFTWTLKSDGIRRIFEYHGRFRTFDEAWDHAVEFKNDAKKIVISALEEDMDN